MKARGYLPALFFFLGVTAMAQQCRNPPDLRQYLLCEIVALEHSDDELYLAKQAEAPAASLNSTALADSSASPDLFGASVSPALFSTRSLSPNANDFSGTLNFYGIYTAALRLNPFDARTYETTSPWRRFSVSLDHSTAVDSRTTDLPGDTNTYTAKAVLLGYRDVAYQGNSKRFVSALNSVAAWDMQFSELEDEVIRYLYPLYGNGQEGAFRGAMVSGFPAVASKFTSSDRAAIDALINRFKSSHLGAEQALAGAAVQVQSQAQIAADFTSRLSYSGGANLYRAEGVLDKGFNNGAFAITTNLSYDFQNARTLATKNRQIIRMVQAFSVPLKGIVPWTKDPIIETFSGEGDYGTNGTPNYKGQFKLSIPARLGWTVPLTFQYVNRSAAGPRADLKAQIGLTFDLDKAIVDYDALYPRPVK